MISEKYVRRYQDVHQRKFSQNISEEEAEQNLINLIALVRLMTKNKENNHGK